MNTEPPLPLAGGVQTALALPEIEDTYFLSYEPGVNYTAARFRSARPEDYHEAVRLAGQGVTAAEICRLLHIHHRTLAAACAIEGTAIGVVKERTKRGLRAAAAMWGEQAAEELSKLKGLPKFIAGGIVVDKLAQLEGEAALNINVNVTHHKGVDWSKVQAGPFGGEIVEIAAAAPAAGMPNVQCPMTNGPEIQTPNTTS